MKRIGLEKSATQQAEHAQAVWNEVWGQQLNRSAETYGKLFAAMRDETTAFVQRRIEADMAAAQAWSNCRSMTDILELQQNWMRCAVEHYTEQGQKMAEICQGAVSQPAATRTQARTKTDAKAAAETERPKAATERKAMPEQAEARVSRAA